MSGWYDRHDGTPIPHRHDFLIGAAYDVVVITCPSCEAQYTFTDGKDVHAFGRVATLIGDHIQMHSPVELWRVKLP